MATSRSAYRGTLLALLAFSAMPLWASTVLTFDVTAHTEDSKGVKRPAGGKPADEHYAMTVTLAPDALQIDRQDHQLIYDFVARQALQLDVSTHSYVEGSLYSRIGFLDAEFANRMMLGRVLAAGEVKDNPMAPALTEHLMSLSDPANVTVIDSRTVGTDTVYSWAKQPLMTVSQEVRDVSAATMSQYLRFLRYEVGGHPTILASIAKGKGIPERLTIVRSNMGIETRTLTLQNLAEQSDVAFSLEGFTRTTPPGEPYATLKQLSSTPAADLQARVSALRAERDAAFAAGQVFDGVLANSAVGLSTGQQDEVIAWIKSHVDQINAEGNTGRLMASLEPRDEASAKQAAEWLARIAKSDNPHSYVLSIFEANVRTNLKDGDSPDKLFLRALAVNPTITGAWIDLAKYYYGSFDAEAAWACWDAARALNPTHPFLQDIDRLEKKLRTDHPEFF